MTNWLLLFQWLRGLSSVVCLPSHFTGKHGDLKLHVQRLTTLIYNSGQPIILTLCIMWPASANTSAHSPKKSFWSMVQVTFVLCSIPIPPLWGVGYWNGIWEWGSYQGCHLEFEWAFPQCSC